MIAISIFALIAAGFTSSALQVRKLAQSNIYECTALFVATSYLEQVQDMEYGLLLNSIANPSTDKLETEIDQGSADWIETNATDWVAKDVIIDTDASDNSTLTMPFEVKIQLTDLNATINREAIWIEVLFRWQSPDTHKWYQKTLETAKANVI
jgi:hypothetical protein